MITDAMIDAAMDALAPNLFGREQIRAALIAAERAAWIEPTGEEGPWLYVMSHLEWNNGKMEWGRWLTPSTHHGRPMSSDDTVRRRVRRLPEMPEWSPTTT